MASQYNIARPLTFSVPPQPGAVSSPFSLSTPITKVVQNDSYTAPAPPAAPPRAAPVLQGARMAPAAVQPVSRTLVTGQGQQGAASGGPAAPPAAAQVGDAFPSVFLLTCVNAAGVRVPACGLKRGLFFTVVCKSLGIIGHPGNN